MIKVDGVSKRYTFGKTGGFRIPFLRKKTENESNYFYALKNASLKIDQGEFVAILGASGSGKSTLMHLIGGLDRPTEGTIEVDGQMISKMKDRHLARYRNEKIGFVFQFFNLLQGTSTLKNVTLPLIYTRKKGINRRKKAIEVLVSVGLEGKLRNRPNQLSGGEQQRVSIARALINDPEIILADEPTGNLDSKTGQQIFDLLIELNKKGKTVVMVTHDQNLAKKAHRIIQVKDGEVV